ncbi:uncharacterized protein EURHEDRAFT_205638 [Aspergillus ruber CBS 135680]|uniref:Uncharacterized protein n=1 Tax=Aspergillus ruber (strain CBS 135680) TaxID=1388766 RepID=A0A017S5E1_ASPRC|nr:uncharacterized protein EURHEDRAFT_205638 [Aspergillus ruber CBS 135680]EYE92162.1 hypothetical protein EURHEDRAFT_205638 [Aspergillus ruber CBS 135680]
MASFWPIGSISLISSAIGRRCRCSVSADPSQILTLALEGFVCQNHVSGPSVVGLSWRVLSMNMSTSLSFKSRKRRSTFASYNFLTFSGQRKTKLLLRMVHLGYLPRLTSL